MHQTGFVSLQSPRGNCVENSIIIVKINKNVHGDTEGDDSIKAEAPILSTSFVPMIW